MSERRVVSRSVAIALGVLCAVLAAGLAWTSMSYTSSLREKEAVIDSLRAEIASKDSRIGELESEAESLRGKIAELSAEVEKLRSQINEKDRIIASLSLRIGELESEIEGLRNQVKERENIIASLSSRIKELESEIGSLRSYIDRLEREVRELRSIVNLEKKEVWVDYYVVSQPAGYCSYWVFSARYAGYIRVYVHSSTSTTTYVYAEWSAYGAYYYSEVRVGASGTATFPVLPTLRVKVGVCNRELFAGVTHVVSIVYHY